MCHCKSFASQACCVSSIVMHHVCNNLCIIKYYSYVARGFTVVEACQIWCRASKLCFREVQVLLYFFTFSIHINSCMTFNVLYVVYYFINVSLQRNRYFGWMRARLSFAILRATNLCLRGSRTKWRSAFGMDDGAGLPSISA